MSLHITKGSAIEINLASRVRRMFAHLVRRYDCANRWMTWGQDIKWRREVIRRAYIDEASIVLDIGTGTGDLAFEARRQNTRLAVVGADFTPEMMQFGRQKQKTALVYWVVADAIDLPFVSGCFDAVVSGYLMRNVEDVQRVLCEQYRVLRQGGRMVCLDTTPPPADLRHLPARMYLRYLIPILGGWASGDFKAYRYLSESTIHFKNAADLAAAMVYAGFRDVGYRCFMGGCMAIHWGTK